MESSIVQRRLHHFSLLTVNYDDNFDFYFKRDKINPSEMKRALGMLQLGEI